MMDKNRAAILQSNLAKTAMRLEANGFAAYVLQSRAEVVPLLEELLPPGCRVSSGGSVTLEECGVVEHLRGGRYNYLDREAPGADRAAVHRQALTVDAYLASANAVTLKGELLEMDGNGNRVAAISFGPESVILVAGRNKLVPDLDAARQRRRLVAAPANVLRVNAETPCHEAGVCVDCRVPGRICNAELVLHRCRPAGRIKVVLVNDELGY